MRATRVMKTGALLLLLAAAVACGNAVPETQAVTPSDRPTASPTPAGPVTVDLISLTPVKQDGDIFAFGEQDLIRQEYGDFRIHGGSYPRSIFAPPPSVLEYDLGGQYDRFETTLMLTQGCEDAARDGAFFVIELDGRVSYRSPQIEDSMEPLTVDLDVRGTRLLRLEVYTTPNIGVVDPNRNCDGPVWGDPVLTIEDPRPPAPTPTAVTWPSLPVTQPGETMVRFYVSPQGSDLDPGTLERPFATVAHARDVVRTLNAAMTGPIEVILRGGTYPLSGTIVFDARDSGSNGYAVSYRAYPGEVPVLSGGVELGGFTPVAGQPYWSVEVPDGIQPFRNLYVNGQRADRAATENAVLGVDFYAGEWSDRDGIVIDLDGPDWWVSDWAFHAPSRAILSPSALPGFARPQDLELHWNLEWLDMRQPVQDLVWLDSGRAALVMTQPYFSWSQNMRYIGWDNWPEPGGHWYEPAWDRPFFIENALELMDRPGEWYYNEDTQLLYYLPREGESPQETRLVIPQLERLIEVRGSGIGAEVHALHFIGLTFSHSSWMRASIFGTAGGFAEELVDGECAFYCGGLGDAEEFTPPAVRMEHAREIVFRGNTFAHLGAVALGMDNNVFAVEIVGNAFLDASDAAITMGHGYDQAAIDRPGEALVRDIRIDNNLVYRVGVEYWSAHAIIGFFVRDVAVSHNHVQEIPNSGISFYGGGFSWGRPDTGIGHNDMLYNRVVRSSLRGVSGAPGIGGDAGALYYGGNLEPSLMRGNYVQDVVNHYTCIYLDLINNDRLTIQQNVCERAPMFLAGGGGSSDVLVEGNYTTTSWVFDFYQPTLVTGQDPFHDDARNFHILDTVYLPDADWPEDARAIIANAGLEEAFRDLLRFLTE